MALQDLTPQLRTRLSRLERLVGLFVSAATLLMLFGLVFYVYQVAQRKGWFLRKLPYFTYVRTGAGLKVGDPVRLMGFDVGKIAEVTALPPDFYYGNVFVAFQVKEPFDGYLWDDSRARVAARDFLGNRVIELTKGTNGAPSYLFHDVKQVNAAELAALAQKPHYQLGEEIYDASKTNAIVPMFASLTPAIAQKIAATGLETVQVIDTSTTAKAPTRIWDFQNARYRPLTPEDRTKGYFLPPNEGADIAERLENVMNIVEAALPGVLDVTNQIKRTLVRAAAAAEGAEQLLAGAQPLLAHLTLISSHLTNADGSLGQWLIRPELNLQLTQTLTSANAAITNASSLVTNTEARVVDLTASLGLTLVNLANLTSNLHAQVKSNTNILSELSRLIVNADDLAQGLKRHWLLRSAFKTKATNAPAAPPAKKPVYRMVSPKDPRGR
jgi:ABC-type transporter Mla subunit MlaD